MEFNGMCTLKKQFKYSSIATAFCLLYPSIATAHAHNGKTDTITVIANTANNTNAEYHSTVDGTTAQAQTAATAGQMLKEVAGVTISGTGITNGSNILMRGYDQKGVKILVDGIQQPLENTMNNLGGIFLDSAMIKRVDVKHGSSSTRHGEGAMGGVVSFYTLDPSSILRENSKLGAKAFTSLSSADKHVTYGGIIAARHGIAEALIAYSQRQRGPIRLADGETMNNHEHINNYFAKAYFYPTDSQTLIFAARHFDNAGEQRELPHRMGGYGKHENNDVDRHTKQKNYSLTYHLTPDNDWVDLTSYLYYSQFNINQVYLTDTKLTKSQKNNNEQGRIGEDQNRTQTSYGLKVENTSHFTYHYFVNQSFTVGSEVYQHKMVSNDKAKNFPLARMQYAAGWMESTLSTPVIPLTLSAGLRYHYYKNTPYKTKVDERISRNAKSRGDNSELIHKAAYHGMTEDAKLIFTPTPWLQLYTSFSTAFRAPTLSEMFNDSLHFSTYYWIPNPHLNPEHNRSWEYGGKLSFQQLLSDNDKLEVKAAYFDTLSKDYITYTQWSATTMGRLSLKAQNLADVYIEGIDVTLRYTQSWFSVGLNYNRTKTIQLKDTETISPVRPETLTAFLQIPVAKTPFSLGWAAQFASATENMSSYSGLVAPHNRGKHVNRLQEVMEQHPGYGIHDFSVSYQSKNNKDIQAALVLANAFNREYYSARGVPQEGRNIKMSLSYRW